jgi:DNA polymerase elongation subunit (family B)
LGVEVEHQRTFSKLLNIKKKHYIGIDGTTREPIVKGIEGKKSDRPQWVSRVFDQFVRQQFKKAIKSDALLSKHFGDGLKLEKALDELIVMYPPVPKITPVPLHGVTRPFADDDKPTRQ